MEYLEQALKDNLKKGMRNDSTLLELRDIIVKYKEQGGEKEKAMTVLIKLKKRFKSETLEDLILELMDFVGGFCSPHMKIWKE